VRREFGRYTEARWMNFVRVILMKLLESENLRTGAIAFVPESS
jgi:hypothetical protein